MDRTTGPKGIAWAERSWELLRLARRLAAERAPAEKELAEQFDAATRQIEKGYRRVQKKVQTQTDADRAAAESAYATARTTIAEQFQNEYNACQQEYDRVRREVQTQYEVDQEAAQDQMDEARWQATAIFEGNKGGLGTHVGKVQAKLDEQWKHFDALQHEVAQKLRRRWQWLLFPRVQPRAVPKGTDYVQRFNDLEARAEQQARALFQQRLPRLFEKGRVFWLLLVIQIASVIPAGRTLGWGGLQWIAASVGGSLFLFFGLLAILYLIARNQSARANQAFCQTLIDADFARRAAVDAAAARSKSQEAALAQQRDVEIDKAIKACAARLSELKAHRQQQFKAADEKYPTLLADITGRRDEQLRQAEAQHRDRLDEAERRGSGDLARLAKKYERKVAENRKQFETQWAAMSEKYRAGMEELAAGRAELEKARHEMFPAWSADVWQQWTPPARIPAAVPFGDLEIKNDDYENRQADGKPSPGTLTLPAVFPFAGPPVLLLKTGTGEGRTQAVTLLQAAMLRLLTALPPGKVRFTIIDPVGLGQNFSAFMHLADFNEQLVSSRIWTEAAHIEQRLTEITAHMEDVIQVYLRNEYQTIEQYNEFAGELAEPYRILVVANFPTGFSDPAAARLLSIASSGGRCGVFTLMSIDTKLRLPREFHLADLERHAQTLTLGGEKLTWQHAEFGTLAVKPDLPPAPERFTHIVRSVGEWVRDADRVEVPFECIVPPVEEWWTSDSRGGIDVPLGRAGAMKFQHLRLGRGTSQHVLIAGKTGSGKSTLLHALITSVAVRYSPDEVELYLVDFKKGVEFKAYAQARLPHARVIAIESEREFGLSVLERLDQELKRRGDLFRKLGVQDVAGFRAAQPDEMMPRVLLVVDEFQELFVEDDRIAQNASLLLDRLVRQGRAFGIHVLLGSQTLAGSYSLPRSTIGQMAVRIALQCSEADSHLILSEENTAARLLQRPGEAIYNDANGLFEGNHPFQVVWLDDHQREFYLDQVRTRANGQAAGRPAAIVFEGNVPAALSQNRELTEWLAAPGQAVLRAPRAYLGAAVAIKEATSIEFARQSGANLLLVGHQEESALGVLAGCMVCLAAQHGAAGRTRYYVLDGTRPDSPEAGYWGRLAETIGAEAKVGLPRDCQTVLNELTEELARREQDGSDDAPSLYLFVQDLGRFRDLRRSDDDFSFSRFDETKKENAASQFVKLLRDGPALGIHVLVWCDTYSNASRLLDRQTLRDLELRVLFQMNATDSSNLIDSPAASQLGVHRAILYNEGQGRLEKFRPYGLPDDEMLASIRRQLAARSLTPTQ